MKLKNKFALILTLLFLAVFIFISFYYYLDMRACIYENITEGLKGKLKLEADNINNYLNERLIALETARKIVENTSIQEELKKHIYNNPLLQPAGFDKDLVHFYVGFEDKSFYTGSGWNPPEGYDPTIRPWYKKAKELRKPCFTDTYIDFNTKKVSVSAVAPLRNASNDFIGVITTDIYLETIIKAINQIDMNGIGYGFLLDKNGVMLAHPNEELVSKNILENEKYGQMFSEIFTKAVRDGKGLEKYNDDGIKKILTYIHIPDTEWVFGMTIIEDKAFVRLREATQKYIYMSIVGLVIIIFISVFLADKVAKQIVNISKNIQKAADGDFKVFIKTKQKNDEIGLLENSFNKMVEKISLLMGKIKDISSRVEETSKVVINSSENIGTSSEEIAKTIQEVSEGADNQVYEIKSSFDIANDLSKKIEEMFDKLKNIALKASRMKENNELGLMSIESLSDRFTENSNASSNVSKGIKELAIKSHSIEDIVETIKSIAEQTNILAINATIEAARAGEQGKGFAVVADEVRKLAEQSAKATEEIQKIIEEIVGVVKNTNNTVNEASIIVENANNELRKTEEIFEEIKIVTDEVANQIDSLRTDVIYIGGAKDNVLKSMESVSVVAEEAAASTQEISAAAEEQTASVEEAVASIQELDDMIKELSCYIKQFRI